MAHAYSLTAGKVESLDSLGYSEFQASLSYCETLSQNTKPKSRKTPEARDDQFLLGNLFWRDQLHQPFMTGVLFLPPDPVTITRPCPGPQAAVPTFTVPLL